LRWGKARITYRLTSKTKPVSDNGLADEFLIIEFPERDL
jgi:hypothetical protein